jgi:copper chaperone CopZ
MCRSHSEKHMERIVMRINAHRGRQLLRTLVISALVMTALGLLGTFDTAAQTPGDGQRQAVVTVQGMQCPFCAYGIKKHLAKLAGVTRVDVELAKNQAIVTIAPDAKVTDEQIQQAIRKAGFTADKIEWRPVGWQDKTTAQTEDGAASGPAEAEDQCRVRVRCTRHGGRARLGLS